MAFRRSGVRIPSGPQISGFANTGIAGNSRLWVGSKRASAGRSVSRCMRSAALTLFALACLAGFAASAGGQAQSPSPQPPTGFDPIVAASTPSPDPAPLIDPSELSGPSLDLMITKSMLYAAGMKHGVNPFLVMGLAWHESGWQSSVVSSAGAVGIMQVMPATAAVDGP